MCSRFRHNPKMTAHISVDGVLWARDAKPTKEIASRNAVNCDSTNNKLSFFVYVKPVIGRKAVREGGHVPRTIWD